MIYKIIRDEKVDAFDVDSETVHMQYLIKEDDIDYIESLYGSKERIYECSYIIHLKREIEIAENYRTNELRLKSLTDMEVFPS